MIPQDFTNYIGGPETMAEVTTEKPKPKPVEPGSEITTTVHLTVKDPNFADAIERLADLVAENPLPDGHRASIHGGFHRAPEFGYQFYVTYSALSEREYDDYAPF